MSEKENEKIVNIEDAKEKKKKKKKESDADCKIPNNVDDLKDKDGNPLDQLF
jgi:hypothetical protein